MEGHELAADKVRRLLANGHELVLSARSVELGELLGRENRHPHPSRVGLDEGLVSFDVILVALLSRLQRSLDGG